MSFQGTVEVEHEGVVHETTRAKLFQIEGEEIWLPISQIVEEDENTVVIPTWLADEKGLS